MCVMWPGAVRFGFEVKREIEEDWASIRHQTSQLIPSPPPPHTRRTHTQLCASAALMANNLGAVAILAYTRRGNMAQFLSRCR
jgi:hypothetical protein